MPDILPVKYKPYGSTQSDGYSYSSGTGKTTQFAGVIITNETNISYAPTEDTNYYSSIEIPEGGYMFINSDSNGHYAYVANDDNSLVNLANNIFGQNFSNVGNALGYILTATTWTVLNYNKSFIPYNYFSLSNFTPGVGIYQEIGNTMCYPKTGTNIYDIDGLGLPSVLNNGPIFSGTTPGFFTFDGTNDYISKTLGTITGQKTTAQIWIRPRYSASKSNYEIFGGSLRLFKTETNTVFTITKTSDNNILFGGLITNINGTDGNLFKSDSGFTLNVGFTPPVLNNDGVIYDVIESSTGKIYIGGTFNSINNTSVGNGIARLNSDGSLDTSFNIGVGFSGNGFTASVNKILEDSSGNLYVGGDFNFFSGQTYNKLIKLNSNGKIDTSFVIGNGIRTGTASTSATFVNDLVLSSDGLRLYVGGEFTTYSSTTVNANRLVRILTSNGNIDSSFNMTTGVNNDVETIALDSSENIYVGGQFTSVLGTSQNRIARITSGGTRDATFVVGTGFGAFVSKIRLTSGGKILLCGDFTTYNGSTYQRLILLNTDGSIDTTLNTISGFNNDVYNFVELNNGSIIATGLFTSYKSTTRPQIIRVSNNGTYESTVSSLQGKIELEFQPYNNALPGYQTLFTFSGTNYDYFGGNPYPNSTTFRNNVFNKWYLITTVVNTTSPPFYLYINGEKVFLDTTSSGFIYSPYSGIISNGTNAFLGDISEYLIRGLTALTDNDVLTYFNQTKSRYGY